MINLKKYLVIFIAALTLFSCKTEDDTDITPLPAPTNPTTVDTTIVDTTIMNAQITVHAAAWQESINSGTNSLTYWENDTLTVIDPIGTAGQVSDMVIVNNDVYIAGTERLGPSPSIAKYWKNGVATTLSNGAVNAKSNSIFVDDNDVYVAGVDGNTAVYWKNGQVVNLPSGTNAAVATSIAIDGMDIYVGGYLFLPSGLSITTLWKNGIRSFIGDSAATSRSYDMKIVGNDVYLSGFIKNLSTGIEDATIWKNGIATTLGNGVRNSNALAVAVDNNNVYSAGIQTNAQGNFVATIWENGVATSLSDGLSFASAECIYMKDNDVYVGGYDREPNVRINIPTYWKNGNSVMLKDPNQSSTSPKSSSIKGIVVQ